MRILLLDAPEQGVIARERIDGSPEGEFILAEDGSIQYRHPEAGVLFANLSRATFLRCVEAWDRYRRDVVSFETEEEQLEVVQTLEQALREQGAFVREGFWTLIHEQAEQGLL